MAFEIPNLENLQIELILKGDHGVVCPGRGGLSGSRSTISCVADQKFPLIGWAFQGIQIEGEQIVEKIFFDLTTEYVDPGTQDIQGVTIPPGRFLASRSGTRPLPGCCGRDQYRKLVSRQRDLQVLSR
jgi:hypothetical protein